jgi:hypothetical protein
MATKEELSSQAIEKAQKLEIDLAEARKDITFLQTQCSDLKKTEQEHRDVISSLRTIKLICQIAFPILLSASIGGLIWSARLGQHVENMEQKLHRLEERLESTRDRILIRHHEYEGTFIKTTPNRIYIRTKMNEIREFPLLPNVPVIINGDDAKLEDLKEGMFVRISLGQSIDGKDFVIAIVVHGEPRVMPKAIKIPTK